MEEELLNEVLTLTRAELQEMCRNAYQNGYSDGQRVKDWQLRKQQEDQFNYDTKTYDNKDCPKDIIKSIKW
jgi:hypothetical protein